MSDFPSANTIEWNEKKIKQSRDEKSFHELMNLITLQIEGNE